MGATEKRGILREAKEERVLIDFWKRSDSEPGRMWGRILEGLVDGQKIPPQSVNLYFAGAEPLRLDGDTLTVLLPPFFLGYVVNHFRDAIPDCVNFIAFDPDTPGEQAIPSAQSMPLLEEWTDGDHRKADRLPDDEVKKKPRKRGRKPKGRSSAKKN